VVDRLVRLVASLVMGHLGLGLPCGASVGPIGPGQTDPISQERLLLPGQRICRRAGCFALVLEHVPAAVAGPAAAAVGDPCDRHRRPVTTCDGQDCG